MPNYLVLRLAVMCIVALLGWEIGTMLTQWPSLQTLAYLSYYPVIAAVLGALLGLAIAPGVAIRPYRALCKKLRGLTTCRLLMSVAGVLLGLTLAALLSAALSKLPGKWGQFLPLVAALVLGSLGVVTATMRGLDCLSLLGIAVPEEGSARGPGRVLLDTSVIIDGRVEDIYQTGFIPATLLVPRFVLEELQHIADSADALRRNRGRRGLDILNRMRKDERVSLEILSRDIPNVYEVDGKLVELARELNCPVLTNDYNLNRVAELQDVTVLNINELANAVKVVVLPGETLRVQIIQEGKEPGQGVGYLDDGTMIVIGDGRRQMGKTVEVAVTRVLQTVAGRMIFGDIQESRR